MKPKTPDSAPQDDLFRYRLDNMISLQHPWVRLAERIDWEGIPNWTWLPVLLGFICLFGEDFDDMLPRE